MSYSDNGSSRCFSGILRLLLCKGSLQTHPSDQIMETNTAKFDQVKKDPQNEAKFKAPANNPGVVARLMGLDSLPDTNWVPQARTPDSVTRSRSVNFMDYLLEFDLAQAQHRRVKTSISFREVPTLLNEDGRDLFVLYLDNLEKMKKLGSKQGKSDVGVGDIKQNNEEKNKRKHNIREGAGMKKERNHPKNLKISKLKDEPRRVSNKQCSSRLSSHKGAQVSSAFVKKDVRRNSGETSKARSPGRPPNQKEVLVESKFMQKKNQHAIKDVQSECSSEDSSPVSVLDLNEFPICDNTPLSDVHADLRDLNSKKKFSSKAVDFSHPSAGDLKSKATKKNDQASPFENRDADYYIKLVKKLSGLTEEDIRKSNWVSKNESEIEEFEEICIEFEQQILDLLLYQVTEELEGFHIENFEVK